MFVSNTCPKCSSPFFYGTCTNCGYTWWDKSWEEPMYPWKIIEKKGDTKRDKKVITTTNPLDTQQGGSHYKRYKIQPVEFCQKNNLPYCESNVIKYVVRHRDKNGLEDLKKAKHYLELIAQLEYGETI